MQVEPLKLCPHFEKYYSQNLGRETFDLLWTAAQSSLPCVIRLRDPLAKLEGDWTPIPWYPGAFEMDSELYREDDAARRSAETLNRRGQAQFGEAASLVPLLLLDVQKGDRVADLCAAPGNKTIGLCDAVGDGCVLANDSCPERCCLSLTRHAQKSRCAGLVISLADATQLPEFLHHSFDRVLCDVPCSADGTLRKHRSAVRNFDKTYQYACELHATQVALLVKAINMCKPGGRVVYSTCSLNPVENEAVVQTVCKFEQVELCDVHQYLPEGCKVAEGLTTWTLFEDNVDPKLLPSGSIPLKKCARLYPHLANVGGFFVAVLKKLGKEDILCPHHVSARENENRRKWRPFQFHPFQWEEWPGESFGIEDDEDTIPRDCVFMQTMKNTAKTDIGGKKVLLVSPSARDIVAKLGPPGGLLVTCGIPLIKRLRPSFLPNASLRWRLSQESSDLWIKVVSKRRLRASNEVFEILLKQVEIPIADVFNYAGSGQITGLDTCDDTPGAVLVCCDLPSGRSEACCALLMASKLALQLEREELQSLRDRLGIA